MYQFEYFLKESKNFLQKNDFESFLTIFEVILDETFEEYDLLTSFYLLYLLANDKPKYYFALEKTHLKLSKNALNLVFKIEKLVFEGNVEELQTLQKSVKQFAVPIDLCIKSLDAKRYENINTSSNNVIQKEAEESIVNILRLIYEDTVV